MVSPLVADPDSGGIVNRQIAEMVTLTTEAEEALLLGDQQFQTGNFEAAVDQYRRGLKLLPNAPAVDARRRALKDRFSTAAIATAQRARKVGEFEKAESLLNEILAPDMLPGNKAALTELERLSDPEATNPALTPEHVENVRKVSQLLQLAEGQYNLGLFDKSKLSCEEVLKVDPHNRAARRMMERAEVQIANYHKTSYDHLRSEMLNKVAEAWMLDTDLVNPSFLDSEPGEVAEGLREGKALNLKQRLTSTTIENFEVSGERLDDALILLGQLIAEASPGKEPVNLILEIGDPDGETARRVLSKTVKLKVQNVPAIEILKYLCSQTGTELRFDPFAARIIPVGADGGTLVSKQFKIPADFPPSDGNDQGESDNPFGDEDNGTSLKKRLSAAEFLKQSGVSFPEGAEAQINSVNNTLYVRNTEGNVRLIEAIVNSLKRSTPLQVVFTTTFVEVNQTALEELGFDWLLDNASLNSSGTGFINGGSRGSDTGVSSQVPPVFGGAQTSPENSITSGLRSGNSMFDVDVINNRLASGSSSTFDPNLRAPGALAFRGSFSDVDFMAVLRGLSQQKGADILLRPSIISKPGQVAELFVGDEFIYPTEYEPPELPNAVGQQGGGVFPVTPATPAAFETRNLGITLEVEPTVGEDSNVVELRVSPEFSDFLGFINYGSPITADAQDALGNSVPITITENQILQPIFRTRRLNTSVAIADGRTIVIGGLKRESRQTVNDSVPILGDIPLIGRFFRSEGIRREQRCVLIFVKVRLVDPGGNPIFDAGQAR